jgi:DNA replication and repair protein RecF
MEMIRFGAEFAELQASVFSYDREKELRAVLFASRRPRQLFLSGVKQKTFGEKMAGQLMSVLFCPEDLMVLRAGGSSRRRLLDAALCQLRPGYEERLAEYTRLLDHKSRILKDWHEDRSLLELLPDFNERMCRIGAQIIASRAVYLQYLGHFSSQYHREFSGDRERFELQYHTVSSITDPFADAGVLYGELQSHMAAHHRAELESGQCLSGPHKDDFEVFLNGCPIKSFGSQGQTRTAAISLKLAEREIIRRDTRQEPVLLLDDVLSELDAGRQDFILNHLSSGQVIITCCEMDRFTHIGKMFLVEEGTIGEK